MYKHLYDFPILYKLVYSKNTELVNYYNSKINDNDDVLFLMSGVGNLSNSINKNGFYLGIDYNKKNILISNLYKKRINTNYIHEDVMNIDKLLENDKLQYNSFDKIILSENAINHFSEKHEINKLFSYICYLLKDNGILIIDTINDQKYNHGDKWVDKINLFITQYGKIQNNKLLMVFKILIWRFNVLLFLNNTLIEEIIPQYFNIIRIHGNYLSNRYNKNSSSRKIFHLIKKD